MKIRKGFVSNSSSSSFVCWGVTIDKIPVSDELLLKQFDDDVDHAKSYIKVNENSEAKNEWTTRHVDSYKSYLKSAETIKTDEEKIEFIKKNYQDNMDAFIDQGKLNKGGNGEMFSVYVGLTPDKIIEEYPETKFGEVKNLVARKLNQQFGTEFTNDDIQYTEQGWYDG
jgi:hypothetical protein